MMWSAGLAVFNREYRRKATAKKVLTHPCIIACVIGLILMLGENKTARRNRWSDLGIGEL